MTLLNLGGGGLIAAKPQGVEAPNPAQIKHVTFLFLPTRFRKQHEQLQAVIVRVLRPAGQPTGAGGDAGDVIETDDLSAVREVKLAYENVKVVDCLDLTPEGNAAWEAALKR